MTTNQEKLLRKLWRGNNLFIIGELSENEKMIQNPKFFDGEERDNCNFASVNFLYREGYIVKSFINPGIIGKVLFTVSDKGVKYL